LGFAACGQAASLGLFFMASVSPASAQTLCQQLNSLRLPEATVTLAESVRAGPYRPPDASAESRSLALPAYCRVTLTLKPSADSDIKAEVWLPTAADWNEKLLMAGGGGFVGYISYLDMGVALQEGYATASTDTGHKGGEAKFALGHPEKILDFAYRAVHETTLKSKAIVTAHYGRAARFSYWQGCSTGGRQGLKEAQRYPEDFDGIIAGAPANNPIELSAWRMAIVAASLKDSTRALPMAKNALLNRAVLDACDALDGVKDRLLTDPRNCHFDPATLLCGGAERDDCLTKGQLETVKMAYSDARKKNGELIYPRLPAGSELGWQFPGHAKEPSSLDLGIFRFIAHEDPNWDWRSFNLESDTELAQKRAGSIEATDPDLSSFKAHGGKLLLYHGWNDGGSGTAISALNSISYYESILGRMGPDQKDWLRLFLVPGMGHCGGGSGPNRFSTLTVLERWRESGIAPDRIIAARVVDGRVDMTRPLCPYPQVAAYNGVGSTNDAANFTCKAP
jgi:feruloyl esterase